MRFPIRINWSDYYEGRATYEEYVNATRYRRAARRKAMNDSIKFWERIGSKIQMFLCFIIGCLGLATAYLSWSK
jgi:hypothetical protein